MPSITHIVILGGSYTGTGVAHNVLKNIDSARVTLINPSDLFYFNIAAPRILAKPKENPLSKVLLSMPDAFDQYSKERFQFVRGSVFSVDVSAKTVTIEGAAISYDYLVVATGSTTPSTIGQESIPFKPTAGPDVKQSIIDAQQRIARAKTIVIAGAGPVGVETAGEIAQAYKDKKVILISSHDQLLPALKASAGAAAESNLKRHGVESILSTKVTESNLGEDGNWTVKLNNGKTLTADLYISAVGTIPNTSFMNSAYLDESKGIKVDSNLRVSGVQDGSIFALGDSTHFKNRYLLKAQDQIPIVAGNLKAAISGGGKVSTYKSDDKLMVFVPTGSDSGTGQIGNFVPFSFMVKMAKSKGFFISSAPSYIAAK